MLKAYLKYITLLLLLLVFAFSTEAKTEDNKVFTVIVDAGHGGKDIGATDNGVKEKDINLKVAKYLESLIKKKLKNTRVVMTRDDDRYLTLQQRADVANKSQGDIFISIHTNSVDKKNKNRKNIAGSSVYTLGLHKDENNLEVAMRENSVIELEKDYEQKYSGFDPQRDESYIIFEMAQKKNLAQSIRFAENIENELVNIGRQNRGVHQAGFWVLWATSMPSVLVELDFICNPESAKYISSDKGAKELAEAIFKALQKYESSWRKALKGGNGDELSDVYIENSDNYLEESYSIISDQPVATAKTRTHKTLSSNVGVKKTDKRKRRSAASRELSINKSFEKSDLAFSGERQYSDKISQPSIKEQEYIDLSSSKEKEVKKDNKKNKKEKKRKEDKKNKEDKNLKNRKDDAHNAKVNKLVTVYKIQILASADLLNQSSSRFCGLSPITTYKENNLYKYYYGESTSRSEMESLLTDVRKKIPDAFIVSSKKSIQSNQ